MTVIQTVSKAIPGLLAKGAGAAALGLILVDSHLAAQKHAHMYETKTTTESLRERFTDTLRLSSPSAVRDTVKKKIFFFDMDNNIDSFFLSIAGYMRGFGNMLLNNVVPLGMATGALLTKGVFSKTCGLGLVAYGLGFAAQEIFRIGQ